MNTDDSKNEEDIKKVDPQVDTQNIRESDEFYTTDGEPVYLGILSEEEIFKIKEKLVSLTELARDKNVDCVTVRRAFLRQT